jgi:transposase
VEKNVAVVALANNNARTIWALHAHDRTFHPDYLQAAAA